MSARGRVMFIPRGAPQPRTPEEIATAVETADRLLDEAETNNPGFNAVYVTDFGGQIAIELQPVPRDPKPGDVVGETLYADRPLRTNKPTLQWNSARVRVID